MRAVLFVCTSWIMHTLYRQNKKIRCKVTGLATFLRRCLLVRKTEKLVRFFGQRMPNFHIFSTDKKGRVYFTTKASNLFVAPLSKGNFIT